LREPLPPPPSAYLDTGTPSLDTGTPSLDTPNPESPAPPE
jgi:hypothetical protein